MKDVLPQRRASGSIVCRVTEPWVRQKPSRGSLAPVYRPRLSTDDDLVHFHDDSVAIAALIYLVLFFGSIVRVFVRLGAAAVNSSIRAAWKRLCMELGVDVQLSGLEVDGV